MNILEEIIARKRLEVARDRTQCPEAELRARLADAPPPRGFRAALVAAGPLAVIAEIKRKSPSAGDLRPDLDPEELAREYVAAGAATLSVLTDGPAFGGSLDLMRRARAASGVPVLRKEFIIDEYQLVEARVHGADAVLLIAGVLDASELARMHDAAEGLGLDVLVEIHNEAELEIVAASRATVRMFGINNRDLKAQKTDLATFERLAPAARSISGFLVAESGLRTNADAWRMHAAGASALLVGESLLRAAHPGEALRALLAPPQAGARS